MFSSDETLVLDSANVNSISSHNERAPAGLLALLVASPPGFANSVPIVPPPATCDATYSGWLSTTEAWPAIVALRGAADGPNPAKFRQAAAALISPARVSFASGLIELRQGLQGPGGFLSVWRLANSTVCRTWVCEWTIVRSRMLFVP